MSDQTWIDVSVPLTTSMAHWPGDPEPNFVRVSDLENGDEANVTVCRISAHTGTHMDAPCHFLPGGEGIERFPLEIGIGPARVIQIPGDVHVVRREHLIDKAIRSGERVLLRTKNSNTPWHAKEFNKDYVGMDLSAAKFLVDAGVVLIGVDYLSVGVFEGDSRETHRALLLAGIWIVEGLDLSKVSNGAYELICMPLRIVGSDGSPARAAMRRR